MARWIPSLLALLVAGALGPGCERFDPHDPPAPAPPASTPGSGEGGVGLVSTVAIDHPVFGGVSGVVSGDGRVDVAWRPAEDDEDAPEAIAYRVYIAAGPGDQDFAAPAVVTAPGVTSAAIDGLPNGAAVYLVARAVDSEGNEDQNRVEWVGVPNPVRYIDAESTGSPANGLTPASAYRTIGQAVGASIALGGVNFHLRQGLYLENVVLFPGMFLHGGFDGSFSVAGRDPQLHISQITVPDTTLDVDAVTILPGSILTGIDGVELDGAGVADNGVFAADAFVRISNCGIRNATSQGITLRSDVAEGSLLEGSVRGCAIVDNGAEGISLSALTDLVIDDNRITENVNEGIEGQWVFGAAGIDTRIEVTRNLIQGNGDEGIDLDLAEVSEADSTASQGARVRIVVRNNDVAENGLDGVRLDLDFETDDGIDCRARIEDNRIRANGGPGCSIDGDAAAALRIARNAITANRGAGVAGTGVADGPVVHLLHSRLLGNRRAAVEWTGHGVIEVRQCVLRSNGGGSIAADAAHVDLSGCAVIGHELPGNADRVRYSILSGALPGATLGEGLSFANPGFELHPEQVLVVPADGGGDSVPVPDASLWRTADIAELRDDGVPREVTAVFFDRIAVRPAPERSARAGDSLFRFLPESIVTESEFLRPVSGARDAGDPVESDRDGSRTDIGPAGGDTPGNVGVEIGLAVEASPLELVGAAPLPGFVQSTNEWRLLFPRAVPADFAASFTLHINGAREPSHLRGRVNGAELLLTTEAPLAAGDLLTLEVAPQTSPDPEARQPFHIIYDSVAAAPAEDRDFGAGDLNGSPADAQGLHAEAVLVSGTIATPSDADYYEVRLAAGITLTAEVVALQRGSPLSATLSLYRASDDTLIASAAPTAPTFDDPVLPPFTSPSSDRFLLRIASTDSSGSPSHTYLLALRLLSAVE